MAQEAFIQGWELGEERGQRMQERYGSQGARALSGRQIADNEWPDAPIRGHEMDGFPGALP